MDEGGSTFTQYDVKWCKYSANGNLTGCKSDETLLTEEFVQNLEEKTVYFVSVTSLGQVTNVASREKVRGATATYKYTSPAYAYCKYSCHIFAYIELFISSLGFFPKLVLLVLTSKLVCATGMVFLIGKVVSREKPAKNDIATKL